MISLTPAETRLRDILIARAASGGGGTITYMDLAAEADPDGSLGWRQGHPRYVVFRKALYHIAYYEAEHGRPMLTAFVVHASEPGKGFPGDGFFGYARSIGRLDGDSAEAERTFWRSEMDACVKYWSAARVKAAGAGLSDAQFDAIMAELSKIKQLLRQLRHS
jgi:hypothetical protein